MSEIEQVVRPFETPENAPPKPYVQLNQPSHPPIFIIAGRTGGGRLMTGTYHCKVTLYLDKQIVEQTA